MAICRHERERGAYRGQSPPWLPWFGWAGWSCVCVEWFAAEEQSDQEEDTKACLLHRRSHLLSLCKRWRGCAGLCIVCRAWVSGVGVGVEVVSKPKPDQEEAWRSPTRGLLARRRCSQGKAQTHPPPPKPPPPPHPTHAHVPATHFLNTHRPLQGGCTCVVESLLLARGTRGYSSIPHALCRTPPSV